MRPVFILISSYGPRAFDSEAEARRWIDAESYGREEGRIYEVTDVRECTLADWNRALVEKKERELEAMRERLGVPKGT